MNRLSEVLAAYSDSGPHFGDVIEPRASTAPATNDNLSRDLKHIGTANQGYLYICVGMLLVIFIGACVFVLKYSSNPTALSAVFAASGISITWLIVQMMKFWKEKVNSDMVLVLARNLTPQDTRGVIEILLRAQ